MRSPRDTATGPESAGTCHCWRPVERRECCTPGIRTPIAEWCSPASGDARWAPVRCINRTSRRRRLRRLPRGARNAAAHHRASWYRTLQNQAIQCDQLWAGDAFRRHPLDVWCALEYCLLDGLLERRGRGRTAMTAALQPDLDDTVVD